LTFHPFTAHATQATGLAWAVQFVGVAFKAGNAQHDSQCRPFVVTALAGPSLYCHPSRAPVFGGFWSLPRFGPQHLVFNLFSFHVLVTAQIQNNLNVVCLFRAHIYRTPRFPLFGHTIFGVPDNVHSEPSQAVCAIAGTYTLGLLVVGREGMVMGLIVSSVGLWRGVHGGCRQGALLAPLHQQHSAHCCGGDRLNHFLVGSTSLQREVNGILWDVGVPLQNRMSPCMIHSRHI